MTASYKVNLYDTSGQPLAVLDNWRSLTIERRLDAFSTHTLSLDAREPVAHLFGLDCFVEVMRNFGDGWYREYIGFHRTPQWDISEDGYYIFTSYGRSMEDLLRRRSILYRAPYFKSGPASDVMKALVYENAGAGSTVPNGRIRNGVLAGLVVAPNNGQGGVWSGQRSWKNLLDILQEIGLANAVDFDLDVDLPTLTFTFRTYYPQKGTDRTATTGVLPHVFATEYANISSPTHVHSRTEEITTVVVLGQGEEAARAIVVVNGAQMTDSPWNAIELARDARNEDTNESLESTGRAEIAKSETNDNFTFKVLETGASVYGRDYFLGDIVTAQISIIDYDSVRHLIATDQKITDCTINVTGDGEEVSFKFGDLEPVDPLEAIVTNMARRLRDVENSGAI